MTNNTKTNSIAGTTAEGQTLLANISTNRASLLQGQYLMLRLVLRQKGKIYWPIFQLAEPVFFRAST